MRVLTFLKGRKTGKIRESLILRRNLPGTSLYYGNFIPFQWLKGLLKEIDFLIEFETFWIDEWVLWKHHKFHWLLVPRQFGLICYSNPQYDTVCDQRKQKKYQRKINLYKERSPLLKKFKHQVNTIKSAVSAKLPPKYKLVFKRDICLKKSGRLIIQRFVLNSDYVL